MTEKRRVFLKDASNAQMVAFARQILNLEIEKGDEGDALRQKIRASGWQQNEIPNLTAATSPSRSISGDGKVFENRYGRKCRAVLVPVSEKSGGDKPFPVGVNGVVMLVPRGEVVPMPLPYIHVLQNSIETRYEQVGNERIERKVPAYPITFMDHMADDIAAAEKAMSA